MDQCYDIRLSKKRAFLVPIRTHLFRGKRRNKSYDNSEEKDYKECERQWKT